jgi:hypothetical protein
MKVASTVAGLQGSTATDGEIGKLRVGTWPDLIEIELVWNLEANKWIGRPWILLTQTDQDGFNYPGGATLTGWGYISQTFAQGFPAGGTVNGDSPAFGTQLHIIPHVDDLWNAGLRLQENISGYCYASGSATVPKIALNFYNFAFDDEVNVGISPTNIGYQLIGKAFSKGWKCTGWVDSPVAAPTKKFWYPDMYGSIQSGANGDGRAEQMSFLARWVG